MHNFIRIVIPFEKGADLYDDTQNNTKGLTERQAVILEMTANTPTISAKAISEKMSEKMSEKNSVEERTVERDLAKLKKLGILVREGGRKEGRWVIKE